MRIALDIGSILFGTLSLIAAVAAIKQKERSVSHICMAAGSLVLLTAVVLNILSFAADWSAALAGCALICCAAICNGVKSGSFHWQHHCIRIALSVILIAGFVFY
ncbi:MAG: hypothetical protein HDR08_08395 [Lachnospiraceae bacterium]|nr:hypothetical protein [Lachnospiraceae bacterium]